MIEKLICQWAEAGYLDEELTLINACIESRPAEVGIHLKAMTGEFKELIAHQFLQVALLRQTKREAPSVQDFKASLRRTIDDGRFQTNVWSYLDIMDEIHTEDSDEQDEL